MKKRGDSLHELQARTDKHLGWQASPGQVQVGGASTLIYP